MKCVVVDGMDSLKVLPSSNFHVQCGKTKLISLWKLCQVPMSISQDNVVLPEMVQVGNTADGCQKAGMESNFESVLPAFTKATAEEDCASLTATSEIAKNGDIKRLNNNHGKCLDALI